MAELALSRDDMERLQRLQAYLAQRETERSLARLLRRYDELTEQIEPLRRRALDFITRGQMDQAELTLRLLDRQTRQWMAGFRQEEYKAVLDMAIQAAARGARSVDIGPMLQRRETVDVERILRMLQAMPPGGAPPIAGIGAAYGRIAANVQEKIARKVYQDGLNLSRRLHVRLAENAAEFNRILATGLQEGRGGIRLAKQLQTLDVTDARVPKYLRQLEGVLKGTREGGLADEIRKAAAQAAKRKKGPLGIQGVSKRVVQAARSGSAERLDKALGEFLERKVRYHSIVIARTEAQAAFLAGEVERAQQVPWIVGLKWHLSGSHRLPCECEELARQNRYGLGPGVYPADSVPERPHPNCYCFQTTVVSMEALREVA